MTGAPFQPIDFLALNDALLNRAEHLVPEWLPGGAFRGHEYVCGSLSGGKGESCSVNITTGKWADFAGDDSGGDLISLYAAIHGLNQGQAARELMGQMGMLPVAEQHAAPRPAPASSAPPWDDDDPGPLPPEGGGPAQQKEKRRSLWEPIVPVPDGVTLPDFERLTHWVHGKPSRWWTYRQGAQLLGYVVRFDKPDGRKEVMPLTWCVDTSDDRGTRKWHWKQWDEPRPLYLPRGQLPADPRARPVLLVEGEKCADAGDQLQTDGQALADEFDLVTWPGGGKAWARAGWEPLRGRVVYLWPDADAKHEPLSKAEREAGTDPASKPLLPEFKQPGVRTMASIGKLLMAEFGCEVYLVPTPKPGTVADGWDLSDAVQAGEGMDSVRARIRGARVFVPPDEAVRAAAKPTPPGAGAGGDEDDHFAWRAKLLETAQGATKACRENVVLALDGLDMGEGRARLPGIAQAQGIIAYNEFTNDLVKLKATPWGSPAGVWEEVDELLLGEWLVREHFLPPMPRGMLEEAVRVVAYRHRYHPVRQYLQGLKWDGTRRLHTWLERAVLEEGSLSESGADDVRLRKYLARAGTWFIQGMCARAMTPGVKFDYMLILEGKQGRRKSTLLATLAGDWFADTGLVLGEKDSYQQLQGRWLYEFPELDAFSKADVTKIKAFIASVADYFRASFDKRARDYPRQLVFGGTTNEDHYLTDPTGNRRFWPVTVTRDSIDIEWVTANRDQLFAEAMQRLADGKRMHPTPDEERELFEPQQRQRAVENAIESAILRWLSDNPDGQQCSSISLIEVLAKIGIGVEKLGPGRFHEKQAAAALRRLGWTERRSSLPGRPRLYFKPDPAGDATAGRKTPTQGKDDDGGLDGLPF